MAMLMVLAAIAARPERCVGETTPQVDTCLTAQLRAAEASRDRYYQAALRQARRGSSPAAAGGIAQAEQAWLVYRRAECGAAYDRYGGTIRTSVELQCRVRLTRPHTYILWRTWLTYPDSTPPVLPRPTVEDALSDGHG